MPVTATIPRCERRSPPSACAMWPGSAPARRPGRRARGRCRRRRARVSGGHPNCCGATRSISRPRSRRWLPAEVWQTITWREGTADWLSSRFARQRVRPAHRDTWLSEARGEEWLLIEWPDGEAEPTKYWLATLPEDITFEHLVDVAKLRWRIERDYQELKQELGLGDYEGRGWRGFHHHATLCIAAYGFLIAERGALPPSEAGFSPRLPRSAIPQGYRPRGAADPTRTAHPQRDRDGAQTAHRRARQDSLEMSLLQCADPQRGKNPRLLTQ